MVTGLRKNHIILLLVLIMLGGKDVHVEGSSTFNDAFAASTVSNVQQLTALPWSRVNNILFSAFNSRWDYLYSGDTVVSAAGPDGFVQYVDQNHTQNYLWSIFKGFSYDVSSQIDMIYVGFENGMSIGYSNPSPGKLYLQSNGNMSCPLWNVSSRCRAIYENNSTDSVTGEISGPITFAQVYDPRLRPWYVTSMQEGDVWTDVYAFAKYNVMGITATTQIRTANGEVIGVIGTDYFLSSIEAVLVNEVMQSEEKYVLFIVDNKGLLIVTSIPGVAVDSDLNQVPANATSHKVINKVAQFIEKDVSEGGIGGWVAANGTVLTIDIDGQGLYWALSTEFKDDHGLHWHIVVVELVLCDKGYYTPPKYSNIECKLCIQGGNCPGGSSLPYPEPGYWVDRSKYEFGNKAYVCSWDTCLGFEARENQLTRGESDDDYSESLYDCWKETSFNNSVCDSNDLQCAKGSTGPLCGSCQDGYTYNSALRGCISCDSDRSIVPAIVGLILFLVVVLLLSLFVLKDSALCGGGGFDITKLKLVEGRKWLLSVVPFSVLKHIDRGMIKVVWATAQILGTVSWNLRIRYPEPFDSLLRLFALLQLDFFALDCRFPESNFITRVLFSSLTPIALILLDGIVYAVRKYTYRFFHFKHIENEEVEIVSSGDISVSYVGGGDKSSSDDEVLKDFEIKVYNQHVQVFLLIGFLVLPTCSMLQFLGLECIELNDGNSYLRSDTSISCDSRDYKQFVIIDSLFIVVYQSIPLLWLALLFPMRDKLNPKGALKYQKNVMNKLKSMDKIASKGRKQHKHTPHDFTPRPIQRNIKTASVFEKDEKKKGFGKRQSDDDVELDDDIVLSDYETKIVIGRNGDKTIQHLAFLWQDYVPSRWYYEVLEMYRRIMFIAIIPVIANQNALRATLGCLISIVFVAFVREASPFLRGATNVVLNIAQYQILLTFFGAFIIITNALEVLDLSPFALGLLLLCFNLGVVFLIGGWSFMRYRRELTQKRWRRALNEKEMHILNQVMAENKTMYFGDKVKVDPKKAPKSLWNQAVSAVKSKVNSSSIEVTGRGALKKKLSQKDPENKGLLGKYVIDPKHVEMNKKIGSGAFGEVFKGTCRGETVAVKTMINITEHTAKLFRAEIILTAKLKHPNIVNFIGCCYGHELTCLILEFVKNGTLGEMLVGESAHDLSWMDPLLKLAIEIARGMCYLHSTEQIEYETEDGVPHEGKDCILHRDLKPDNVLITEFMSAKITDFGTSRAKDPNESISMSGVGTPLFCAPEIIKGDVYDESVDVYSYGLILLDLATEEDLIDFIGERWRLFHNKKSKPKQAMRFIRAMSEDGWRPLTPISHNSSSDMDKKKFSTNVNNFYLKEDARMFAMKTQLKPFGVLGQRLMVDGRIETPGPSPHAVPNCCIVDPAGLHHIQPPGGPSGAGGAAGAIYKWLGISVDDSFPADIVQSITKPCDAKYHVYKTAGYGSVHVIHAVGPDFRENGAKPIKDLDRGLALKYLSKAYYKVFKEFVLSGQTLLRLLPISSGIFSGPYAAEMPVLTFEAIQGAYLLLDEKRRMILSKLTVHLCIFAEVDMVSYKAAGFAEDVPCFSHLPSSSSSLRPVLKLDITSSGSIEDGGLNSPKSPPPRTVPPPKTPPKTRRPSFRTTPSMQRQLVESKEELPTDILPLAPKSIVSLICRCTHHDPKQRPTFPDILHELETKCSIEIQTPQFMLHIESLRESFSSSIRFDADLDVDNEPDWLSQKGGHSEDVKMDEDEEPPLKSDEIELSIKEKENWFQNAFA